jgi:hypothetical protein
LTCSLARVQRRRAAKRSQTAQRKLAPEGQRRRHWQPFVPRTPSGAAVGWAWPGGGNLAPGPLGSVAGDPDRHRGWILCPSLLRTCGCRPGAEAARVPGSQACAAAPSTSPDMRCNSRPLAKRLQTGTGFLHMPSHFHKPGQILCDSDWRSSVNQGRGSLFQHTGCTTR